MADDFQVKQSSSSSGAYGLGGAILGGFGAGAAAHHFTRPKYGSFEDILAESKDSFDKKIENAAEDDKQFLKDAKALKEKQAGFEAEYDKKFEEFKKANGSTKVETDAYKALVKAEEEANTALINKKNELINKEIERLKAAATGEKSATIEKSLNNKVKQIFNATKRVIKLQEAGASKEEIAKATAYVNTLQKEAEELAAKIAEKVDYGKLTGEALDNKKKEVVDAYKLAVQDRVNQKLNAFDKPIIEPENVKLSKDFLANRKAIQIQNTAVDNAEKELEKLTGIKIEGFKKSAHGGMYPRKIMTVITAEESHIEKLNTLKEAFKKVTESGEVSGEFSFKTLFENLRKLGTPGATFEASVKDVEAELTKYLSDTKGLSKEQQAAIRKLVNGEINAESIQKALDNATNRVESIRTNVNNAIAAEEKLEELAKESKKLQETMNKKGVYVREKDGVVIDKKTGKPAETPKPKVVKEAPAEVKLPKDVNVPKDVKIEYTSSKAAAELSEEELKKQAEAAVKPEKYATETSALADAKAAREAAYGKLEDGVAKSEEEIKKAFQESINATDAKDYAKKQGETAKKEFAEKYAEKLKRRFGFAEHTNLKIAGAIAAGAVVVGAIASAFAPKDNA